MRFGKEIYLKNIYTVRLIFTLKILISLKSYPKGSVSEKNLITILLKFVKNMFCFGTKSDK